MVNVTYFIVIMLVKMSVLLLYLRTFTESRLFRYTVYATLFLLVGSHVPLLVIFIVAVTPVYCAWTFFETDEENIRTCHKNLDDEIFLRLILFIAVLTVVLDIIVLSLPCRAVWRLHLPQRQRLAILITLISGVV